MNKFELQIHKALLEYEEYKPYKTKSIDWICNRIDWCWKWRKISAECKDNFCDRIIEVMKGED